MGVDCERISVQQVATGTVAAIKKALDLIDWK